VLSVVQQNLAFMLLAEQFEGKERPGFVTRDRKYPINWGSRRQVMHFGSAYTNGDTIVYFPNLKVVALGKHLTSSPIPDYGQGGCLPGCVPVLGKIFTGEFPGQAGATG